MIEFNSIDKSLVIKKQCHRVGMVEMCFMAACLFCISVSPPYGSSQAGASIYAYKWVHQKILYPNIISSSLVKNMDQIIYCFVPFQTNLRFQGLTFWTHWVSLWIHRPPHRNNRQHTPVKYYPKYEIQAIKFLGFHNSSSLSPPVGERSSGSGEIQVGWGGLMDHNWGLRICPSSRQ